MSSMHLIAIDPGVHGAAFLFDVATGAVLDDHLTPADLPKLRSWLEIPGTFGLIEEVHASPVQGPSSAFAFGRSFGEWLGAFKINRIALFGVTPQQWQYPLPAGIRARKDRTRKTALRDHASQLSGRKLTLQTADAYLIGHYAVTQLRSNRTIGKLIYAP